MHELRLVAVSEDGAYLVLASTGRGTRFMLPVDDRLRAAVRGQFSRLGQYEIEVENPLRPKEIQARIRSGETAEAISEISGIPIERVRWFEGPVLQEREYVAQQAQRATVRPHGDAAPGPSLEDLVTKRIGAHQLETGDATWDSWKREDRSWQLRLVYLHDGEDRVAHWLYEPRHNSVTPADEEAARFSSAEPLDPVSGPGANVTPFTPRRTEAPPDLPRMDSQFTNERQSDHTGPRRLAPTRERAQDEQSRHPANGPQPDADQFAAPVRDDRRSQPEEAPAAERPSARRRPVEPPEDFPEPHTEPGQRREPEPRPEPAQRREPAAHWDPAPAEPAARTERTEPAARQQSRRAEPPAAPEPEAEPPAAPPAAPAPPAAEQRSGRRRRATIDLNDTGAPRRSAEQPPASAVPAAASGDSERPVPKRKGRGRRASVPSWDEIMFGSKKGD